MMEEAKLALQAYDFQPENDRWYHRLRRNRTTSWQEVEGGFLRFDPENGAWIPIPYGVKAEFKSVEGMNFRDSNHSMFFTWIWPPDEVTKIYQAAWKANREYIARREAEKGQAILNAIIDEPKVDSLLELAVSSAVDNELTPTEPPKKHWWSR